MSDNYRYNIRDPRTHRFTRLTPESEKPAMTIDNATGEPIESANVPATIDLMQDENMLRKTLATVADGLVSMSKFAKQVESLEARVAELTARLDAATVSRDAAVADAAVARHDAEMARQAYDTVNTAKNAAVQSRNDIAQAHASLGQEHLALVNDYYARGEDLDRTQNLLNLARTEREELRHTIESLSTERDNIAGSLVEWQDKHTTLSTQCATANDELAIAREALTECSNRVADWKCKAEERQRTLDNQALELSGLHHKVNGLEADNTRQGTVIIDLNSRLANIRNEAKTF